MAEHIFGEGRGLKVLVTRYFGRGAASQVLGQDVASQISTVLPEYLRSSFADAAREAGVNASQVRVEYVPCLVSSHNEARRIGSAWAADVVLWGQASCDLSSKTKCQDLIHLTSAELSKVLRTAPPGTRIEIGSGNTVQSGPKSRIQQGIVINADRSQKAIFKTSLTVVKWHGLEVGAAKGVRLSDPLAIYDLDFPHIAAGRPLALFHFLLGLYAYQSTNYGLAAKYFERSQDEVAAAADNAAELNRWVGFTFVTAGDTERGMAALQRALNLCPEIGLACRAKSLQTLGWANVITGKLTEARAELVEALSLWRKLNMPSSEANTLLDLAALYAASGDYEQAQTAYTTALPIFRNSGNKEDEAATLTSLGAIVVARGDAAAAVKYHEKALPIFEELGHTDGKATTLNNLGFAWSMLGDKRKASEFYERALPIVKQSGDLVHQAHLLNNIGLLRKDLGEIDQAKAFLTQALDAATQTKNPSVEAVTLTNRAALLRDTGDWDGAIHDFQRAIPLFQGLGDRANLAQVHVALATAQAKAGRDSDATISLRTAGRLYLDLNAVEQGITIFTSMMQEVALLKSTAVAEEVVRQAELVDPSRLSSLALRALLFRARDGDDRRAVVEYRHLAQAAGANSSGRAPQYLLIARVGIDRAEHSADWKGCPGVLITQVHPQTQADKVGLRAGDAILQYGGTCMRYPTDLVGVANKMADSPSVPMEIRRGGQTMKLPLRGGRIGVTVSTF